MTTPRETPSSAARRARGGQARAGGQPAASEPARAARARSARGGSSRRSRSSAIRSSGRATGPLCGVITGTVKQASPGVAWITPPSQLTKGSGHDPDRPDLQDRHSDHDRGGWNRGADSGDRLRGGGRAGTPGRGARARRRARAQQPRGPTRRTSAPMRCITTATSGNGCASTTCSPARHRAPDRG